MDFNNTTYYYDYEYDNSFNFEWYFSFKKKEEFIQQYVYAFFLLVGTIGNLPCAFYLAKYRRTAWSVCFYLVLSMLFGLVELYIYCGNLWFLSITGRNLTLEINILSNAVCKVYNFTTNVLIYMSSWIMTAISIETMITIKYPHRMYKMCTVEKARAIVLLIIVLVVSFNLHYFWTIGLSVPETDPDVEMLICHNNYQPHLSDEITLIIPVSEFLLDSFIPFILVSVFVTLTITSMISRKKDITFELKKYIVDINTLNQLQKPTIIMLIMFSMLKGIQCVEHIIRFINSRQESGNQLQKETMVIPLINFTMTYFFISFKPILFVLMCRQLRQDMTSRLCSMCNCGLCQKNKYKSYIAPEVTTTTSKTLMSSKKQTNGDALQDFKCTNV